MRNVYIFFSIQKSLKIPQSFNVITFVTEGFISFAMQNLLRLFIISCVLKPYKLVGAYQRGFVHTFEQQNEHCFNPEVFINRK